MQDMCPHVGKTKRQTVYNVIKWLAGYRLNDELPFNCVERKRLFLNSGCQLPSLAQGVFVWSQS